MSPIAKRTPGRLFRGTAAGAATGIDGKVRNASTAFATIGVFPGMAEGRSAATAMLSGTNGDCPAGATDASTNAAVKVAAGAVPRAASTAGATDGRGSDGAGGVVAGTAGRTKSGGKGSAAGV